MRTASPTTRTAIALAAIFAVALGARLLWIANTDTALPPLSDPQYYHATATNLADGRGYIVAVDERGFVAGPEGEPTAFWPPGYPLALAPLYRVFGDDERVAKAFNAIAGALTVIPVFFIARALARTTDRHTVGAHGRAPRMTRTGSSDAIGLLAAAIFGLMPSLIYWMPALFSEPLFTLGLATTFAFAIPASNLAPPLRSSERGPGGEASPSLSITALTGAVLIATAFVRSQALILIIPIAILLIPRLDLRAAVRALAPIAIMAALMIVPWMLRNDAAMGRPFVINDNLCYNLRASHAPYSTGGSVPPQDLWDEQPGISFKQRELLFDDLGCDRAWEYARTHPGRELELAPKRVGWLLRSDAADAIDWSQSLGRTPLRHGDPGAFVLVGDIAWYPILALALLSVLVLPRTRIALALWMALALWAAMHVAFHGEPRYHVPMTPLIAALAAATIVVVIERIRARV